MRNYSKCLCVIALTMVPTLGAFATTIDFERSKYDVGDLAGQDGWQQREGDPSYVTILRQQGGSISGSGSASIIGGAGGAGGNVLSAYKNQVAGFQADGTAQYDISVRFLYRKTQSSGFGGLSISDDGLGDGSAGVRVNETTIEALTTGETYVNLGTYGINDVVEFSLDIDLDTSIYHVSMRNDSAGETVFTRLTETPLDLQVPLATDNVAIMISGQYGQSIYDDIVLNGGSAVQTSVFTTQAPTDDNFLDSGGPYELGMMFSSTSAGNITAIRHWKAPDDNTAHVGRIWDASGNQLAEVTFADNTGAGWKEQALPISLAIETNSTYVVSVNSGTAGHSGSSYPYGSDLPMTNGDLRGSQGAFIGFPGSFPNVPYQFHYFRDIVFVPEGTEEPTVCIEGKQFVSVTGPDGPFVRNSITVNGGAVVPPDNLNDLPTAFFGGTPVFYQFVITNCGTIDLLNVRLDDCADLRSVGDDGSLCSLMPVGGANGNCVEDPRLIPFSPPRIVAEELAPGESVSVTSADFLSDPISSVDICDEFGQSRIDGIVRNNSEVEADADLNGNGAPDECADEPDGVCRGGSNNPAFVSFHDLNMVQCK